MRRAALWTSEEEIDAEDAEDICSSVDPRAYHFFKEHSGYMVGHRAEGALRLARAECLAKHMGMVVGWEPDLDPDTSLDTEAHEYFCAVLRGADGAVLASLCGIADPDRNYTRVVEAELALEALDMSSRVGTRSRHA